MNNKKLRATLRINVSNKKQITIHNQFYNMLNMGFEITYDLRDNEIVLRPVPQSDDFSEEILKDLVAQGFSGQEFQKVKSQIRPAVEKMIEESSLAAEHITDNGDEENEEPFGDLK